MVIGLVIFNNWFVLVCEEVKMNVLNRIITERGLGNQIGNRVIVEVQRGEYSDVFRVQVLHPGNLLVDCFKTRSGTGKVLGEEGLIV